MISRRQSFQWLACTTALLIPSTAQAAQSQQTVIEVKDMHCGHCARKIAGKLYAVSGVVEVRTNVKKNLAYVKPGQNKVLSPRALWEAVEKAKFTPVRLAGPNGTFSEKPGS